MNIGPSQRQQEHRETPLPEALRFHERVAARRYWQARLFVCSLTGFSLSLLAWLIGLPWALHLLVVLAGFCLGFLYPLGNMPRWALGWIAKEAGLSYQTALELDQEDAYGFAERVRERAARSTVKLRPPKIQAWWLPLTALALGLALLPALSIPGPKLLGTETPREADADPFLPSSRDPQITETPSTQAQRGERASEAPQAADSQRADQQAGNRNTQDFNQVTPDASGGSGHADIDEETLSRFLDNLRERPENLERTPAAQQARAANPQGERSSGDAQQRTQGEQREGEASSDNAEARPGEGQGDNGETGQETASGSNSGAEGEETASSDGDSSQSDGANQTTEGQENSGNNGDDNLNPFDPGGSAAQGDGQSSQDQQGLASDPGSGAGNLASGERSSEGLDEDINGDPDTLRGRIGAGPVGTAGTVQLPGQQTAPLAEGRTPESYDQAVERAISEGRIPVEYQEIIRNYFR